MNYKPGDLVECIDNENVQYKGARWEPNMRFCISSTRNNIAFGGVKGQGVYFHSIKLVETFPKTDDYSIYN